MTYDPKQVAFVDIETTGLDPERNHVWEIAVIVDDVEHCWIVELPGCHCSDPQWCTHHWTKGVSPWVLANTNIVSQYGEAVRYRPAHSWAKFSGLVAGRHLVGMCPWFDSERLHRMQLADSVPVDRAHSWHYHLIDVETLIVGWLAASPIGGEAAPALPWKSEDLSRAVGVDPEEFRPKHSALVDARWAKACFEAVMGAPS